MDPNRRRSQEGSQHPCGGSRSTNSSNFDSPNSTTSTAWTNVNEHSSRGGTTVPVSNSCMLPSSGIFQNTTSSGYPLSSLQTVGTDAEFDTTYLMAPPQWETDWESWDSGNTSQESTPHGNTSEHGPYEMGLSSQQGHVGNSRSLSGQQGRYFSPGSQQRPLPTWTQTNVNHSGQSSWAGSNTDQSPYTMNNSQQYYEQSQYNTTLVSPNDLSSSTMNLNAQVDQRLANQLSNMNSEFSFTSPPLSTLVASSRRPTNHQRRPSHSSQSSSKSKSKPSSRKRTSSPPSKASSSQKQTHNAIEKQYRLRLNMHFSNLLAKIPPKYLPISPENAPTSKAEILVLAEHYIKVLEREGMELSASNRELVEDLEALKREWERVGGWVGSPVLPGSKGGMP
ncbi:hypothetical protein BGZ60DRAFT_565244 [Tricladium varicosporioides]|nr:hypothetical protein BGZ60DRAFT_565244 [Hymenoscyphus varicosporioides]